MGNLTNYFVEGLQGAGKTTMVKMLSDKLSDYEVFREGDYSPVELAWCAYVTETQYKEILTRYSVLESEIVNKTVMEEDYRVICYTQILTDVAGFHKDLERYEIYNGNLDRESFETIILKRYQKWNGKGQILYLDVEDIRGTIELIKKERSDESGNELWFPLMLRYIEESPYGKKHSLHGMDGLITHLKRRRALEHRIIDEIFKDETVVIKSHTARADKSDYDK